MGAEVIFSMSNRVVIRSFSISAIKMNNPGIPKHIRMASYWMALLFGLIGVVDGTALSMTWESAVNDALEIAVSSLRACKKL